MTRRLCGVELVSIADAAADEGADGEVAVLRELVDTLRDQNFVLQQQLDRRETELEARRRELGELHVLLQQAQRQLPAPQANGHQPNGRHRFWPWGGKT
jgi:hypothetical protein